MGRCFLCPGVDGRYVEDVDLMRHLREEHPDQFQEPEAWPDGEYVVIDQSLEPEDFVNRDDR